MADNYPNPWNFKNTDKRLISTDGNHRIVYYDLGEIAMGAPIGGKCVVEFENKRQIKIGDWCGGPPIWHENKPLVAIPIWKRFMFKGTLQQIGVINTETLELQIFSKTFRVLDLRKFDNDVIYGYDSPIYNPKELAFDVGVEKAESTVKLMAY